MVYDHGTMHVTDGDRRELPADEVDGFRMLRVLGRGATAEVYLVADGAGRRYALKHFVSTEQRFSDEARWLGQLDHPALLDVHALGALQGRAYLVVDYVDGLTLRQRMAQGPMDGDQVVSIVATLASALETIHRASLVHGDLKPENVMIDRGGGTRLLDLGCATISGQTLRRSTPAYLAPELRHGSPATGACDVWALGVLCHELLLGRRPELGDRGALLDLAPIDSSLLRRLVRRCLRPDPGGRPSAAELADQLEDKGITPRVTGEPYVGAVAFGEADGPLYFGREREVDEAVRRLARHPLLVVTGPTAVGKSSFVNAGVIARLRRGDDFTVIRLRADQRPLERLAHAVEHLEPAAEPDPERCEQLARLLTETPELFGLLLSQRSVELGHFVIVVEVTAGFAEVAPEVQRHFYDALSLAVHQRGPLRVLLVVPDVLLSSLMAGEGPRGELSELLWLSPLTCEAMMRALHGPAAAVGHLFEPEDLPRQMAQEAGEEPLSCSMLQRAALLLWRSRDAEHQVLGQQALEAAGGVVGLLCAGADRAFTRLSAEQRPLARLLLLRLLTVDGERRALDRASLLSDLDGAASEVLDALLGARLVVAVAGPAVNEPVRYQLAHADLATRWSSLVEWAATELSTAERWRSVLGSAEIWQAEGRSEHYLLADSSLKEILQRVGDDLEPPESLAASERDLAREHLRRSIETARGRRRLRIYVALTLLLGLAGLALGALWRRSVSPADGISTRPATSLSRIRRLLEQGKRATALMELRSAIERKDAVGLRALWWHADQRTGVKSDTVMASPPRLACRGPDYQVVARGRAIDFTRGSQTITLAGHAVDVQALCCAPAFFASTDRRGAVTVWRASAGRPRISASRRIETKGPLALACGSLPAQLIVGDRMGNIFFLDVARGALHDHLRAGHAIEALTLHESVLRAKGPKGHTRWQLDSTEKWSGHRGQVIGLRISGRWALSVARQEVVLWALPHLRQQHRWTLPAPATGALAVSAKLGLAAAAGGRGTIWVWNISDGSRHQVLSVGASVSALAFSRSGTLLAGDVHGSLHGISLRGGQRWRKRAHQRRVVGVCSSATGQIVAAGADGRLLRWASRGQSSEESLRGPSTGVVALACAGGVERLAVLSKGGEVWVWEQQERDATRWGRLPGGRGPTSIAADSEGLTASWGGAVYRLAKTGSAKPLAQGLQGRVASIGEMVLVADRHGVLRKVAKSTSRPSSSLAPLPTGWVIKGRRLRPGSERGWMPVQVGAVSAAPACRSAIWVGYADGSLRLHEPTDGATRLVGPAHRQGAPVVLLHPLPACSVLAAHADGSLHIWSHAEGLEAFPLVQEKMQGPPTVLEHLRGRVRLGRRGHFWQVPDLSALAADHCDIVRQARWRVPFTIKEGVIRKAARAHHRCRGEYTGKANES